MQKKKLNQLLLLFLLVYLPIAVMGASGTKVQIAIGDYPPYLASTLPDGGPVTRLVKKMCKQANLICQFHYYPWARASKLVEVGAFDLTFPWLKTDERLKRFKFSAQPLYDVEVAAFYDKRQFPNGIKFNQYADLQSLKAVGILSYWYENIFRRLGLNTRWVSQAEQAWQLLENQKADVFVDDIHAAKYEQKLYAPGMSKHLGVTKAEFKSENANYILYNKNDPKTQLIRKKMDAAFIKLEDNGTVREVLSQLLNR